MKSDSKSASSLFDKIRVKPDKDRRAKTAPGPVCEWHGCKERATNKAPKGRGSDKEYWNYCLKHAREYNQSYNFFAGMNDAAVLAFQKDALTGHRPTWKADGKTPDPQRRAQGARPAGARCRRYAAAGENPLQGAGETVPSGCERGRSLHRRPAGGGHSILQLPEIGRLRLNQGMAKDTDCPSAPGWGHTSWN